MDIPALLNFLKCIGKLKELERWRGQFFWRDYPQRERYESVADHTWRMAMIIALVEKHLSKPIDLAKTFKMCFVHDLPELIAGDASPLGSDGTGKDSHAYNQEVAAKRHEDEKSAAKEIFGMLPNNEGEEFYNLWLEFEKQETFEAQVVKFADKVEGKLQSAEYLGGAMFKEHLDFNLSYGAKYYEADPLFLKIHAAVLEEFTKDYKEFTK
jgi:putative hydrolase of HD superfamily